MSATSGTSSTSVAPNQPPAGAPTPLAGSARAPAEPSGVHALEAALAQAARRTWQPLPPVDRAAAVEAGLHAEALTAARAAVTGSDGSSSTPGGRDGGETAAEQGGAEGSGAAGTGGAGLAVAAWVGATAAVVQRQGMPATAAQAADWSGFGAVVPVLAGSPGAGASVLAALMGDVLQRSGQRVLIVDAADPPRSGLAMAARCDGPGVTVAHPQVRIRFSWRAQALLARVETSLPVLAPGMVPPPRFWRSPVASPQVTVVDIGHDAWRATASSVTGVGGWLRQGRPAPSPVLVVRASRPSLLQAEQVLARLQPWVQAGVACPVVQLVVMGAKRWPAGVAGAAGRRVSALLGEAVFVPHDAELAAAGVTAAITPHRLRGAVEPMLRRHGLTGHGDGAVSNWSGPC